MRPRILALAIPVGIGALLTGTSAAQINAVELARVGDPISGGATITGFSHLRTNDRGDWAAIIETDSMTSPRRLYFNGDQLAGEGDPAPHVPGETVMSLLGIDLADDGRLAALVELGTGFAVYIDGELILQRADLANAGGLGAGSWYADVYGLNINANEQVLLRCFINDPTTVPTIESCLIRLEIGAGGAITSETLLGRRGDIYPGQVAPLFSFFPGDNTVGFGEDGLGTWTGILGAAAPGSFIAYKNAAVPMYQGNRPAFAGGPNFLDVPLAATAYSTPTGSWALSARLDVPNLATDGIIILDGAVYAREGANLASFPGAPVIDHLGRENLYLTDGNELVFYVDIDTATAADEAIVRGGHTLLRKGAMLIGGARVTDLADVEFGFHASDSGNFLIAQAELDNTGVGLVYLQDEVGTNYCAAENNSTGVPSVTFAQGVALTSQNSLSLLTVDAPPGSFAYYISSMSPGNVLFPGGSSGRICISGSVGRHIDGVAPVLPDGTFRYRPDLTTMPTSPNVAVMAGDTWHFQLWHRDANLMTGGATSNFSLPFRVTFH